MDKYAGQALNIQVPDAPPLKNGVRYPWLEPTMEQINEEALETNGTIFGHCAASPLMKLRYAARMVRVDMCYSINCLSRCVTRWDKLCDRRLSHLFSYLNSHINSKLNGRPRWT